MPLVDYGGVWSGFKASGASAGQQNARRSGTHHTGRVTPIELMQLQDLPILMYHSISCQANRKYKRFTVSPDLFARHMAYLLERAYVPITVGHAVRALSGVDAALPEHPVGLTFDAGFAD